MNQSSQVGLAGGFAYPLRGWAFLVSHPKLWKYAMLPYAINTAVLMGAAYYLYQHWTELIAWLVSWIVSSTESWLGITVHYAVNGLAIVLVFMLFLSATTFVGNIIASPFNELLARRTLRIIDGKDPDGGPITILGILKELWLIIRFSLLNLALLMIVWVGLLAVNLIPGGSIAYFVLSYLSAFLFHAQTFADYPMGIYGWRFRDRWRFMLKHIWPMAGFGAWSAIPCIGYLLLPVWVVSATMMFRRLNPNEH